MSKFLVSNGFNLTPNNFILLFDSHVILYIRFFSSFFY